MSCEICSSKTKNVKRCKICTVKFCGKCGDIKKRLCSDCNEYRGEKTATDDKLDIEEEEEIETEIDTD